MKPESPHTSPSPYQTTFADLERPRRHRTHRVAENSRRALRALRTAGGTSILQSDGGTSLRQSTQAARRRAILAAVRSMGAASDREIMVELGYSDPNTVRPRITELLDSGELQLSSHCVDPSTGRRVRRVSLVRRPSSAESAAH